MIGQTFSHYRILEELGSGGMGVVYKAEDSKLKRSVALKFLPHELTRDKEAKTRFIHEARAASALQHNNICTIHEIDETDEGRLFICMDYYEGETLKDKVANGPLPADEALDLTIHAAEGLVKAHAAGMVHRDIKAANLIVTNDGVVKILDFGLAKLAGQTKVTKTGTTVGTVAYMSPEQATGQDVDQRSDVWSLGVVLYELLSGELPFKGDHELAVLYGITHSDPQPVTDYRRDIPEELDWIIGKSLSKEPDERYDTSVDFLNDLRAALKSVQDETGAAPTVMARRQKRKGKSVLLRPAVVTGVIAAAVVIALLLKFLPGREQAPPTFLAFEGTPRVAVAQFENKTGDPALDNLAGLATETVTQDLAGLDLVETVLPGATSVGGETTRDADGDADIIVSGAVHLEGEDIGLVARVVDTESGRLISALPMIRTPRGTPGDAIGEVSQRVMGAIAMRLHNPFRQVLPTHPPTYEAFQEYRLGLDTFDAGWGARPVLGAIEHFKSAVTQDSTFLRPLVMVPPLFIFINQRWALAQADTALMDLEEIKPQLDRYERLFVGMLREQIAGNNQAAAGEAERLERIAPEDQLVKMFKLLYASVTNRPRLVLETYDELNPTEDQERRLAFALQTRSAANAQHALGRYEEELKLRQRLIEYYPNLVLFRMDEAWAYAGMGRIDEIRRVLTECQAIPGGRGSLDWSLWNTCDMLRSHGHREAAIEIINDYIEERLERPGDDERPFLEGNLARLLYGAERWDEARAIFEKNPDNRTHQLYVGLIAARLGDNDTANRIIEEFVDTMDDEPYSYGAPFLSRASFAALMGDRDRAVLLLREAGAQGMPMGHYLFHDMDLESLHGYPPFEELIRPKG